MDRICEFHLRSRLSGNKTDYYPFVEMKTRGLREGRLLRSIHSARKVVSPSVSFQEQNRTVFCFFCFCFQPRARVKLNLPHSAVYKPLALFFCGNISTLDIESSVRSPHVGKNPTPAVSLFEVGYGLASDITYESGSLKLIS